VHHAKPATSILSHPKGVRNKCVKGVTGNERYEHLYRVFVILSLMKILIIEGIPTSGKSSLIKNISELLGENRVKVYGEPETHIPIMDKPEELHIEFFESLLQDAARSDADLVIFDRFYFTQAIRAKVGINAYSEIEDLLARQKTLVVYLQVDESAIADRVRLAAEHRDKERIEDFEWGEYFQTKGETSDEIAKHYAMQQRDKKELLNQSKLKSRIFDTTHHEYQAIADQIINEWYTNLNYH
jgi:thymidylate kinase